MRICGSENKLLASTSIIRLHCNPLDAEAIGKNSVDKRGIENGTSKRLSDRFGHFTEAGPNILPDLSTHLARGNPIRSHRKRNSCPSESLGRMVEPEKYRSLEHGRASLRRCAAAGGFFFSGQPVPVIVFAQVVQVAGQPFVCVVGHVGRDVGGRDA